MKTITRKYKKDYVVHPKLGLRPPKFANIFIIFNVEGCKYSAAHSLRLTFFSSKSLFKEQF